MMQPMKTVVLGVSRLRFQRWAWKSLALSCLLAGPTLCVGAGSPPVLAIVGGMLVDGNGGSPVHDSVVVVQGSTIVTTGSRGTVSIPTGAKVIDARGLT